MIMLHWTEKCPFDSKAKKFGESIPGHYQKKLGCGGVKNEEGMTNEGKVFPERSVGAKIPGPFIFLTFSPSSRVKLFVQKVIGSMTLTSPQKEDPLFCIYKYLQYVNHSEFISFWRTHYSNLSQNKNKSEKEICTNKWFPFQSHLYPIP